MYNTLGMLCMCYSLQIKKYDAGKRIAELKLTTGSKPADA